MNLSQDLQKIDNFLADYLSVLNSYILAFIRKQELIGHLISGGKALNTMVKRKFQVNTIDFDISVYDKAESQNPSSLSHSIVRDSFGQGITDSLNKALLIEKYRLEPIEKYHNIKVINITYGVANTPFKHYSGFTYKVGHVSIVTQEYGNQSIIDIVPLVREEDSVTYAGINFLSLDDIVKDLTNLMNLIPAKREKYSSRLETIRLAKENNGLSCNYYRYQLTHKYNEINNGEEDDNIRQADNNVKECVKNTIFGVLDPLYPRLLRMIPKRFIIDRDDILRNYQYIYSLSKEDRDIIKEYTGTKSASWNLLLFHNSLYPEERVIEDPKIAQLQRIILNAPPLESNMQVYRISRYYFFKNTSNENLKPGVRQYQATFMSTSYDNELSVNPFLDLFAICCCYLIKIPAGSKVLIIGEASKFSTEAEILLPYGCGLDIEKKSIYNTTSSPGEVFYNELTSYTCNYVTPAEMKKFGYDRTSCIGNDCVPTIGNEKLWNKILKY